MAVVKRILAAAFFCSCMGNMKDWTGVRQGRITVLGYAGEWRWKCKCDCGTVFETGAQSLRQGILSCGCMHKEEMSARLTKDETGKHYGRLTVLRRASPPGIGNFVKWFCKCDCGRERVVRGSDLRSGLIRDCGAKCPLRDCGKN